MLATAVWLGYGMAAATILFFGGYSIARGWLRRRGADFTSALILSATSALAAWMVLLLWASVFHIRLGPCGVRILAGGSVAAGLVCFVRDRAEWQKREYWLGASPPVTAALWAVLLLSVAIRLFAARELVMLPGSDAYHHALIAQLFAEQGGIPHSYEPYAPLVSFSYHFGFHSLVALVRWLLASDLLPTVKAVALILNGGIAATAALLGEHLAGSRRAGVITAATVGLIAVSPFCLLSWSRFTQTTGLLFLAPALLAVLLRKRGRADVVVASLLVAATALSHARVAFYWGLFVLIVGAAALVQHRWSDIRYWAAVAGGSILLTVPWLLRLAWVQSDPYGLQIVHPVLSAYNDTQRLGQLVLSFATNRPTLIASLALAAAALVAKKGRDRAEVLALVAWSALLVGGALLAPLAGFSFWDLKTVLLSLTVPAGVVAGLGGEVLLSACQGRKWHIAQGGLIAALTVGALVATGAFPALVRGSLSDLQPADLDAMRWVQSNVPEDALFMADVVMPGWAPGWVVGYGAGYWIPLLAQRASVVPPMLYGMEWAEPPLPARVQLLRQVLDEREGDRSLGEILSEHGITHIFTTSASTLLVPDELSQDEHLEALYHQDRVWVFAVRVAAASTSPNGEAW